jgi:hypothetical protein
MKIELSQERSLSGNDLIIEERWRQKTEEGWTEEHDDHHESGELTQAANCYCTIGNGSLGHFLPDADQSDATVPQEWPWQGSGGNRKRDCVILFVRARCTKQK